MAPESMHRKYNHRRRRRRRRLFPEKHGIAELPAGNDKNHLFHDTAPSCQSLGRRAEKSKIIKPYPDGIWPRNPCTENTNTAIPYAGITQVRFKGYLLSLIGTPCAYASFSYSKAYPKSSRFLPA